MLNEKVGYSFAGNSSAARMRPKRPWPPRNKIAQIIASTLYQFSAVRKWTEVAVGLKTTSVTDDVNDWPIQKKITDCATAR